MSYRIERAESVELALRRITTEQIDKALAVLVTADDEPDQAVHEARKRFKKIRALLRLVRPAIGDLYQQENVRFRDAGRELAPIRDAESIIEGLDALAKRYKQKSGQPPFVGIRASLVERRRQILNEQQDLMDKTQGVVNALKAVRDEAQDWRVEHEGFEAIAGGLKKTYERGRKRNRKAYEKPSISAFHEWRKRVKYHRYHIRLLQNIWPKPMKSRRKALKQLSDLLGDDHDLAELVRVLTNEPERFEKCENLAGLHELIETRGLELCRAADPLGKRLFTERPKQLVSRFEAYWHAWQQESA